MKPVLAPVRDAQVTRRRIVEAGFLEFYRNGFQGGSLNHIVEAAGTTKGALFHHFSGKQDLGYAVVDEVIEPLLEQRWIEPIRSSKNPLLDLNQAFRRFVQEDIESGAWLQGCPLNNLAQEMSPLDEGFRKRIDRLYAAWRQCYASAFANAIKAGKMNSTVAPANLAALTVAAQMGIWGTAKSTQDMQIVLQATDGICQYLHSLKSSHASKGKL